jgi:hypothetical protein
MHKQFNGEVATPAVYPRPRDMFALALMVANPAVYPRLRDMFATTE